MHLLYRTPSRDGISADKSKLKIGLPFASASTFKQGEFVSLSKTIQVQVVERGDLAESVHQCLSPLVIANIGYREPSWSGTA